MSRLRLTSLSLALAALATAACSDQSATQPDMQPAFLAHQGAEVGTTDGWEDGETVTFFYNKDYFCNEPPSSGASSKCELGAEPEVAPRGGLIPTLYVIVPLGIDVPHETLQCPDAGACIDHPSTFDLSRVFGAGTEDALLPPHSHILGDEGHPIGANSGWWDVDVVGVTDLDVWNQIVAGKSLETVRWLQAAGTGITGDIPTNLYLFFGVRPRKS